jgi:hypothetical protein
MWFFRKWLRISGLMSDQDEYISILYIELPECDIKLKYNYVGNIKIYISYLTPKEKSSEYSTCKSYQTGNQYT